MSPAWERSCDDLSGSGVYSQNRLVKIVSNPKEFTVGRSLYSTGSLVALKRELNLHLARISIELPYKLFELRDIHD